MFIVTARIPKKKLIGGSVALACCFLVLAAALILSAGGTAAASAEIARIRNNDDRVACLNSLGWTVVSEPIKTEELLVPETFDDSYTDYLALQAEQGFDLNQYRGRRITRYTYRITNYPDGREDMTASLLVFKKRIIGGQVQSADGSILHGLAMPK